MLEVQLLGPPQVLIDGKPVRLARRKNRGLFYYLAAHSEAVSREHILAVFWPDHARSAAQQSLRTALYGLRKQLAEHLVSEAGLLALDDSASAKIDRRDWGLTWNQVLDTGGVMISDEIGMQIELKAIKQAENAPA